MFDKPSADEIERLMHELAKCRVELDHTFATLVQKYGNAVVAMALAELVWREKCKEHVGFVPHE